MTIQSYTPKTDGEIKAICEVRTALSEWNHPLDPRTPTLPEAMAQHYGISPAQRDAYNSISHEKWMKLREEFDIRNFRRPDDAPMVRNAHIAKELFTSAQYEAYMIVQATLEKASQAVELCWKDVSRQMNEHGYVEVPTSAIPNINRAKEMYR